MSSSSIEIQEVDTTGRATRTYALTTSVATGSDIKVITRLDDVSDRTETEKRSTTIAAAADTSTRSSSFINTRLATLFLPTGYPHTVTADYTPYQIYDSLQAFMSQIAGLLSSRAVLQSLGVDSESSSMTGSSSTATYATLLSIVRSTISNLSTILFADHMSSRIGGEVKFYRFLADILNDAGFLLEMVSPSLPSHLKVPSLCLSSALRAMCGVAGGASKAILSTHFAVDGNIGELNAKDGSQETLVNLVGMWVGGVVVSKVDGLWATWCWMIVLLGLHLWFNWLAVTSVRLRGLNLGRAGRVFGTLIMQDRCENVDDVGRKETIFGANGAVYDMNGALLLMGKMGVGLHEMVRLMGSSQRAGSKSEAIDGGVMQKLLQEFAQEKYLLWFAAEERNAVVLLKEGATRDDQLKAWCHAVRVSCLSAGRKGKDGLQSLQMISETLSINNSVWQDFSRRIEAAGWDISATVLESTPGTRLRLLVS